MAEISLKRQRDEEPLTEEPFKKQKSYEDILFLLDEEEEEQQQQPISDLSFLITTLQQEISATPESDEGSRMMKHLLEASDDELFGEGKEISSTPEIEGDLLVEPKFDDGFGDGLLWEIEDEAANYYALLQSELFM